MVDVPDFQSEGLNAEQVVSALQHYGCCVIRQIAAPAILKEIADSAQKAYDQMDQKFENGLLSEKEHRHCYRYGIVRPFEEDYRLSSGVLMKDAMLSCLLNSVLREAYTKFFQTSALNLLVPSSHLRRVKKEDAVPWHQDASVMRLQKVHFVNSWFPLDPAGMDAPCVEIIPQGLDGCLPFGLQNKGGLYGHLEVSQEQIADNLHATSWKPILFPGDVLLLHCYTVHQTNANEEMTKSRRDFELRFGRRDVLCARNDINQIEVDFS